MCVMCLEIQKGMNILEVGRALREFSIPKDHQQELSKVLKETHKTLDTERFADENKDAFPELFFLFKEASK